MRFLSQLFFLLRYRRGKKNSVKIALTFDDGPSLTTPQVLDILQRYSIKATFFLIPENIRRLREVAHQIIAEGHEVGAHVAQPDNFAFWNFKFWREKASRKNITDAIWAIEDELGLNVRFFRPSPELAVNVGTEELLRQFDLISVVGSAHSRVHKPVDVQRREVIRKLGGGKIILLHDGHDLNIASIRPDDTVNILPAIIIAAKE